MKKLSIFSAMIALLLTFAAAAAHAGGVADGIGGKVGSVIDHALGRAEDSAKDAVDRAFDGNPNAAGGTGGGTASGGTNASGNIGKVENTGGRIAYTGGKIPAKYNGQWIIAAAVDSTGGDMLFAAAGVRAADGTISGAQVSGGNITLQVWETSGEDFLNFKRSGTYTLMTYVMRQPTMSKADWDRIEAGMGGNPMSAVSTLFAAADVMGNVAFSSGTGSGNTVMFIDF